MSYAGIACHGKAQLTRKVAMAVAKRRKCTATRTAYRCVVCRQWHVGTKLPKKVKRERRRDRPEAWDEAEGVRL